MEANEINKIKEEQKQETLKQIKEIIKNIGIKFDMTNWIKVEELNQEINKLENEK